MNFLTEKQINSLSLIAVLACISALLLSSATLGCGDSKTSSTTSSSKSSYSKPAASAPSTYTRTVTPTPTPAPAPAPAPQPAGPTFHGYSCTDDCSGHEAGYEWAMENGITDPDDCGGNSNSFIEGCMAYAEEYQEEYGSDYEDEDEDYYYEDDY